MTRKIVSEMTYDVSMGTLNPTIPSSLKNHGGPAKGRGLAQAPPKYATENITRFSDDLDANPSVFLVVS